MVLFSFLIWIGDFGCEVFYEVFVVFVVIFGVLGFFKFNFLFFGLVLFGFM